jgi:protein TonB
LLAWLVGWWCLAGATVAAPAQIVFPRPLERTPPEYPETLREARVEGDAVVGFQVDAEGRVFDSQVHYSTHVEFGEAAAEAVLSWRFVPGSRNGQRDTFRVKVPFTFRITPDDALSRWAGRNVYRPLETEPIAVESLESWPQPAKWIEPYYPPALRGSGEKGEVVVSFVIDEHGTVINPEVLSGENPHFATSALVAAISLRFPPYLNEAGDAVPLQMALIFHFDEKRQKMWDKVNARRMPR